MDFAPKSGNMFPANWKGPIKCNLDTFGIIEAAVARKVTGHDTNDRYVQVPKAQTWCPVGTALEFFSSFFFISLGRDWPQLFIFANASWSGFPFQISKGMRSRFGGRIVKIFIPVHLRNDVVEMKCHTRVSRRRKASEALRKDSHCFRFLCKKPWIFFFFRLTPVFFASTCLTNRLSSRKRFLFILRTFRLELCGESAPID